MAVYTRVRGKTRQLQWRRDNPERARGHWNKHNRKRLKDPIYLKKKRAYILRTSYGMTQEHYDHLLAEQSELCAICGRGHVGPGKQLHVDHDHTTNKVRGLLCAKCNTFLGSANDDIEILKNAIAYLEKHKEN